MGFEAAPTYKLTFENPALDGLEVRVRGGNIRLRQEWDALVADDEVIEWFPKILVDWNIVRDGKPVPCTADGIREVEEGVFNEILKAWRTARRVQPPAPLELPSPAGEPPDLAEIPMQAMPENLAS